MKLALRLLFLKQGKTRLAQGTISLGNYFASHECVFALLGTAVSSEIDSTFYCVSSSDLVSSWVGESEK